MKYQPSALPQLPARPMEWTLSFYCRLGFDCEIVSPAGDYAIPDRSSLEVHSFQHDALVPSESSFGSHFRVNDVDKLFPDSSGLGLPSSGPKLRGDYGATFSAATR